MGESREEWSEKPNRASQASCGGVKRGRERLSKMDERSGGMKVISVDAALEPEVVEWLPGEGFAAL